MAKRRANRQASGHKYKIVEKVLWGLYGVRGRGIAAFRAQIRHLRNIGVPRLTAPGSGHKLDYSFVQVAEIAMALALELLGVKPSVVAELARTAAERAASERDGQDCYAIVLQNDEALTLVFEHNRQKLLELVDQLDCVLIMNVAQTAHDLEAALCRETTA